MRSMSRLAVLLPLALAACSETITADEQAAAANQVPGSEAGTMRQYGTPVKVGEGRARSYVLIDNKNGGAPLEIGVALDATALNGLPQPTANAPGGGHNHGDMYEYQLALPPKHGTPYQFVSLDWNAGGHEPPGVYDIPHFDFHFYTVSKAERDAIVPTDPAFAQKAANFPGAEYVPAGFMVLPPPPAPVPAVPMMGVHWSNLASPEIQPPSSPNYAPFTHTFINGSWDGRFIFSEPMITRAFLLTKPDITVPISTAAKVATPGYHPTAYRITWDGQAKEYRIALSGLAKRN